MKNRSAVLLHASIIIICLQDVMAEKTKNNKDPDIRIITKDPQDSVFLQCKKTDVEVMWNHNSKMIAAGLKIHSNDKRYSIITDDENSRNLHIKDLKYGDRGKFTCKDWKNNIKSRYDLKLRDEAKIVHVTRSVVLCNETAHVNLMCNASGYPPPVITWYIIDEMGKLANIGITGSLLQIRNISRHCSTTYRCEAYNGALNAPPDWRNITLKVQYKPRLDIYDENEETQNEADFYDKVMNSYHIYRKTLDRVILKCSVRSFPNSEIMWYRNSDRLSTLTPDERWVKGNVSDIDDYVSQGKHAEEKDQYLTLDFRAVKDTFTRYTCRAENQLGTDECSIIVHEKNN